MIGFLVFCTFLKKAETFSMQKTVRLRGAGQDFTNPCACEDPLRSIFCFVAFRLLKFPISIPFETISRANVARLRKLRTTFRTNASVDYCNTSVSFSVLSTGCHWGPPCYWTGTKMKTWLRRSRVNVVLLTWWATMSKQDNTTNAGSYLVLT